MLSKRLSLACLLSALLTPPWAAPGSALTPYLVEDINEEVSNGASAPTFEVALPNGVTLFQATENGTGRELWRSDGTPRGTFFLLDACPGPCTPTYQRVVKAGDRAFILLTTPAGGLDEDLWVTSGSPPNTHRVTTGLRTAHDRPIIWVPRLRLLFFVATDSEHGFELWRSDGTEVGTYRLTDLAPGSENAGPAELTLFRGSLAFVADDGSQGPALWVSDGTLEGTRLLRDPVPARADHPAPAFLAAAGSTLIFSAPTPSGQTMLWRSDGTRPGTVPFANLVPGPDEPVVHGATAIGGRFYFVATTPGAGQELWSTDGTAQGTRRLTHLVDSEVRGPGEVRLPFPAPHGKAAFTAFDEVHGIELWLTDGTPAGTRSTDICPGDCSGAPQLFFTGKLHGDRLYFPADDSRRGTEMWTSDGTVAGTRLLRDLCPGSCSSNPATSSVALGDVVLFTVNAGPNGTRTARLFRTDGTPAGTVRIASYPSVGLTLDERGRVADALLFFGPDAELWRTDGTAAGTGLLKDIQGIEGLGSFPNRGVDRQVSRVMVQSEGSW